MITASRILHIPRPNRLTAYIQSRLRPLDIDFGIVSEVLTQYELELTALPRNLPNTRRNRNLIVNTSSGKKILKLYRSDWRTSTIVYEHSILKRLAQLSFPAPGLMVTTDGNTFINKLNHNYALFDFVTGTNYSSSFLLRSHRLKLMAKAGQTLAHLHSQLEGFLPEGQHHLGFVSYVDGRHRDIAWHTKKIEELKAKSSHLTVPQDIVHAKWLVQNSHFILEELSRLDELLSASSLPRVIIHGDYGLHNIIFQESGIATPVDFELARLEWRLSDLTSCLTKIRYGTGDYDFESLGRFMEAYQSVYPLSVHEWELFPQAWRFYKLMGAVQYWNSYYETGGPTRKLVSARDAIDQADWALRHPDKLFSLRTK